MYTEYETTVVLRPDISGDTIESTLDRLRNAVDKEGGKLIGINHWGKKKLAYEVNKHNRGIYVHTQYLGAKGLVSEIERNLRISDNVLRYLTVQLGINVAAEDREVKAYEKPDYDKPDEPERRPMSEAEYAGRADKAAPADASAPADKAAPADASASADKAAPADASASADKAAPADASASADKAGPAETAADESANAEEKTETKSDAE